jgi:site-specific DNA recombinase
MPDKPLRAVIWAAVSDPRQANTGKDSLPSQEQAARAFCEKQGMDIVAVLRVPGFSRYYIDIRECAEDMAKQGIYAFRDLLEMFKTDAFDVFVVRAGDRFGREQAIHAYVVSTIVKKMNARIYETSKGLWIDKSNFRTYTAMDGFRAASEVDGLSERVQMGLYGRFKAGKSMPRVLRSHKRVYGPDGQEIGLEVDESQRPLWNDVKRMLLAGKSWYAIQTELYEKGYRTEEGTPIRRMWLWRLLNNPYFWGHTAYRYYGKHGPWAYDESAPVPKGVEIKRNTHPPFFPDTDPDTARLKAELTRRASVIQGSASPEHTHMFTGLLACPGCERNMSASSKARGDKTYTYYRCQYRFLNISPCRGSRVVSSANAQKAIDEVLNFAANHDDLSVINPEHDSLPRQINDLERALSTLERNIDTLITEQLEADPSSRRYYAQRISTASQQADAYRTELHQLQNRKVEQLHNHEQRQIALAEFKAIDNFWELDTRTINQMLHRIFLGQRFVIQGDEILRII